MHPQTGLPPAQINLGTWTLHAAAATECGTLLLSQINCAASTRLLHSCPKRYCRQAFQQRCLAALLAGPHHALLQPHIAWKTHQAARTPAVSTAQ